MSLCINKCFMRCVSLYMPSIKWRKKGKVEKRCPSVDWPRKYGLHLFQSALKDSFADLQEVLNRKRFKDSKSKFSNRHFRHYQMALTYRVFPCETRLWNCGFCENEKSHLFLHVKICAWTLLDILISTIIKGQRKTKKKAKHQNQTKKTSKMICFFTDTQMKTFFQRIKNWSKCHASCLWF